MIEISLALDWRLLVAVLVGLVSVGLSYNAWIDSLNGEHEGGTAWLVVGGVAFTLTGAALLVGLVNILLVVICFAASGLPMMVGEYLRHRNSLKKQAEENKRLDLEYIQRMKEL